ncbi:MAG: zf-HC2 domain-containing protein [Acidobacteria bacterium]|nr:zf-HC2 domain-containing protein [Acidobacteriota bacterium]MBI3488294.1 zf-HC2 domain-containing protein [Acidobacteriota bacterium]
MMTPHVLDQLPLWIEGDLAAPETAALEAHLSQCPECRRAAERLRDSQAWLREALEPPFEAPDRQRLRARVMEQICTGATAKPGPRMPLRRSLLLASAATLLLASLIWNLERARPSRPVHPGLPAPLSSAMPPSRPEPTPQVSRPRPAARPSRARSPESPPLAEPARIEFQTSDPAVRIIWLAQAKPPSEPIQTPLEAP